MFADVILLCGNDETEESISGHRDDNRKTKTQFIDFYFG